MLDTWIQNNLYLGRTRWKSKYLLIQTGTKVKLHLKYGKETHNKNNNLEPTAS